MTTSNILTHAKKRLMIIGTAVIIAIAFASCEKGEIPDPVKPEYPMTKCGCSGDDAETVMDRVNDHVYHADRYPSKIYSR